jgi:hypothetical protein
MRTSVRTSLHTDRRSCGSGLLGVDSNLHGQAEKDFAGARRKAFLRRIRALLRRDPGSNRLLSFEEVSRALGAVGQVDLDLHSVPISKIVGSVGRHGDFDRAFLPAKGHLGERWKRIDRMLHRAGALPPVSLYKIGESYFVLDGHHRVSVARYHGAHWIDARVIEFLGRVSEKTRLRPELREHRVARQDRSRSKASMEHTQNARLAGRATAPIGQGRR